MDKLSHYLGIRAVRLGIMAIFVATFFGAPALGYITGNKNLQKLDLVEITANTLGLDGDAATIDLSGVKGTTTGTVTTTGTDVSDGSANTVTVEPEPDRDADGLPDSQDLCPDEPATTGDGCPLDSDGDGVHDEIDACPQDWGSGSDGCEPDSDGDGVKDAYDYCIFEAGTIENDGCPEVDPFDYYDGNGEGHNYGEEGCFPFYDATGSLYEAYLDANGNEIICEKEEETAPVQEEETALPDLKVSSISISSTGKVMVEVKGEGEISTDKFGIYIYIDENTNDSKKWTYSVSTLASQGCLDNGVCSINPQYVDSNSSHTVRVHVDPNNVVAESNENNNQDSYSYTVEESEEEVELPDLKADVYLEDDGTVVAEVKNVGGPIDTEDWHVWINVDGHEWNYSLKTLSDSRKGCLEEWGVCEINPEIVSLDEEHSLEVKADSSNDIEESDENNNYAEEVITPTGYYDDNSDDDYTVAETCDGWEADDGYCEDFGMWNWLNGEWCVVYNENWETECEHDDYNYAAVCGSDGVTYDSEEEAELAGVEVDYWGDCGVADRRELYDMQRSLDNDRVDFDEVLERADKNLEELDKYIDLFNHYVDEAEERDFAEFSELKEVAEGRIDLFEGYKDGPESVKDDVESYVDGYEEFIAEAEDRYDLVAAGDRGSQYFWDYWQKHGFYWTVRETLDRKLDPYGDHGVYDLIGREWMKIAYEAANQEALAGLDWSALEDVEDVVNELDDMWDEIVDELDNVLAMAEDAIADSSSMGWDEVEDVRWDIEVALDDVRHSIDDYWQAKEEKLWGADIWSNVDEVWQSINWARESEFATAELEELLAVWRDGEALNLAKDIFVQPYEQDIITELIKLRDEKLIPSAEFALEAADEKQHAGPIWYFFDEVLRPTEKWATPKLEYLADRFYSEYYDQVSDADHEVVDEFFGKFGGFNYDLSNGAKDMFEFGDDEFNNFAGLVDDEILDQVIERLIANLSPEVIRSLNQYNSDLDGGIGLGNLMNLSAHAVNADELAQMAGNLQIMAERLAELQAEKNLKSSLRNLLKDITGKAGMLYGDDVDDLMDMLLAIDADATDEEIDALRAQFELALAGSSEAKYKNGLKPFPDFDEDAWYYNYVGEAKDNQWVSGYSDGTYGPGNPVTNAESIKMILGALDFEPTAGTPQAVNYQNHWSKEYAVTLEGLLGEIPSDMQNPDDQASRKNVAYLIVELLDLEDGSAFNFSDVPYGLDYIDAIASAGIMTGDDGVNRFRPYDGINRAELAKVINIAADYMEGVNLLDSDVTAFEQEVQMFRSANSTETYAPNDWATNIFRKLGTSLLGVMENLRPSVLMVGIK